MDPVCDAGGRDGRLLFKTAPGEHLGRMNRGQELPPATCPRTSPQCQVCPRTDLGVRTMFSQRCSIRNPQPGASQVVFLARVNIGEYTYLEIVSSFPLPATVDYLDSRLHYTWRV